MQGALRLYARRIAETSRNSDSDVDNPIPRILRRENVDEKGLGRLMSVPRRAKGHLKLVFELRNEDRMDDRNRRKNFRKRYEIARKYE